MLARTTLRTVCGPRPLQVMVGSFLALGWPRPPASKFEETSIYVDFGRSPSSVMKQNNTPRRPPVATSQSSRRVTFYYVLPTPPCEGCSHLLGSRSVRSASLKNILHPTVSRSFSLSVCLMLAYYNIPVRNIRLLSSSARTKNKNSICRI